MHTPLVLACLLWLLGLMGGLVALVARARSTPDLVLALDTLALVLVALLGLHGAYAESAASFDAALVLALLSFVQTVVAARLAARGRAFR